MKRQLTRALSLIAVLLGLPSTVFAITIDLHPAFEFPYKHGKKQVIAVGRDGLFLDSNVNAPAKWQGDPKMEVAYSDWANPKKNFTWLDVVLEIDDVSGNAVVQGTMRNNANHNDLYYLSMNLSEMCVRNSSGCTAKADLPDLDLHDFLTDPANAANSTLGMDLVNGLEWSTLSLNVTSLPGGPNPNYTGVTDFVGWPMPPMHERTMELHIWSNSPGPGNLYFKGWYQAFDSLGRRIGVGDTKAFGVLHDKPVPPTEPIPEPSTLLLFGAAGLGLLSKKKKLQEE